jgi:hypothetical protein
MIAPVIGDASPNDGARPRADDRTHGAADGGAYRPSRHRATHDASLGRRGGRSESDCGGHGHYRERDSHEVLLDVIDWVQRARGMMVPGAPRVASSPGERLVAALQSASEGAYTTIVTRFAARVMPV